MSNTTHRTNVVALVVGYRAECDCAWMSPWFRSMTEAVLAGQLHELGDTDTDGADELEDRFGDHPAEVDPTLEHRHRELAYGIRCRNREQ